MSSEALIREDAAESGSHFHHHNEAMRSSHRHTDVDGCSTTSSRDISEWFRRNSPLAAASGCLVAFSVVLYLVIVNWRSIPHGISYIWCGVALLLPLIGLFKMVYVYVNQNSHLPLEDPNAATICSAEVCINNETVLTVRSWWPMRMVRAEVERHGVRVAMSSARRWLADNSQPGGKVSKVKFTETVANHICCEYICDVATECDHDHEEHGQCSVCLDDIESGHRFLRMKKCGHKFHQECLATWIAQSSRVACLLCRADHHDLIPESVYTENAIKEEPTISILSVTIESGFLVSGASTNQ